MTIAVEPGCTIAQITDALAARGQMVALDAAHAGSSTIGGAYATGMSGPRRFGGGSLKDWVIGVEVAGCDGVIARAGGMVVKNVTGYDMMHVHYGALGAFGVVTRINLKVFPLPGPPRSVVLRYQNAVEAWTAGTAVLRSQLQPSSIVVAYGGDWSLRMRCDGPPTAVGGQVRRIVEIASTAARPQDVEDSEDTSLAIQPFLDVTDLQKHAAVARLSVPATQQLALVEALGCDGFELLCADLGSGLVYVAAEGDTEWVERLQVLAPRPVFLRLPTALKHGLDVFGGLPEASAAIVRRMKQQFDPAAVLNRGRFVLHL
jgi:glycolate oxidase FAD binding subunit